MSASGSYKRLQSGHRHGRKPGLKFRRIVVAGAGVEITVANFLQDFTVSLAMPCGIAGGCAAALALSASLAAGRTVCRTTRSTGTGTGRQCAHGPACRPFRRSGGSGSCRPAPRAHVGSGSPPVAPRRAQCGTGYLSRPDAGPAQLAPPLNCPELPLIRSQPRLSRMTRAFSRTQSRSFSASRLSCCFLPLARPTASFTRPLL